MLDDNQQKLPKLIKTHNNKEKGVPGTKSTKYLFSHPETQSEESHELIA